MQIGCLAGAILVLLFGEKIGRRRSTIYGATIMILGVIIQCTTYLGYSPLVHYLVLFTIAMSDPFLGAIHHWTYRNGSRKRHEHKFYPHLPSRVQ
jgi:MFS family permease